MSSIIKKGSRACSQRVAKPHKRKFRGNQYTLNEEASTSFASTSAEKLKDRNYDDILFDPAQGYVLIHFLSVFNFISDKVQCKRCHDNVKFVRSAERGLGFKLHIQCKCEGASTSESSPLIDKRYEINVRIVFVMRLLGVGLQGINLFCSFMDICHGLANTTYYSILESIFCGTKSVFEIVREDAGKEEIKKNAESGNEPLHLSVSGDGSWKKRGFSSLFGVRSIIGKYSSKVLDVVIKSSSCQSCNHWKKRKGTPEYVKWEETHMDVCSINHEGSAGKMEVDAITEMFSRSEKIHGVKYVNYIGDGDTKTFKAILSLNPYNDVEVNKKECVGHVQKRMGTHLRAAKKSRKGIGGKGAGKLTNRVISNLTKYYGLAIRRHPNSVEDMKNAVWATFYHMSSTDDNPLHQNCPEGEDSWCKWQKAKVKGEEFNHPPPLNDEVLEAIRPIYEHLSSRELLERCTGGNTQNNNESFNSCAWSMAPKHLHCGAKIVQIAALLAACVFNNGYTPLLKVMNAIGIAVGPQTKYFAESLDQKRVMAAEEQTSAILKKIKMAKRESLRTISEFYEETEGLMYGPGIAD